jgi:hypothetical protein
MRPRLEDYCKNFGTYQKTEAQRQRPWSAASAFASTAISASSAAAAAERSLHVKMQFLLHFYSTVSLKALDSITGPLVATTVIV